MIARLGISPDQDTEGNLPSDPALFSTGVASGWGAYVTAVAALGSGLRRRRHARACVAGPADATATP